MQRDLEALLWGVHEAGRTALEFSHARSLDDYLMNNMLRSAVEQQLEIVGEALQSLRRFYPEEAAKVSSLDPFIRVKDGLSLESDRIHDETIWTTLQESLPRLVAEAEVSLDEWHQG